MAGEKAGTPSASTGTARPTVVLRAGPPPKGRVVTPLVAVLGILLLLGAVALGAVLPKHDVLPNQFRVSYLPVERVLESQHADLAAPHGDATFDYDVATDDVYQVKLGISVADDMPASDPDRFVVELRSPSGELAGKKLIIETPESTPILTDNTTGLATDYKANVCCATQTFNLGGRPDDEVVETANLSLTAKDLGAQLQLKHRTLTKGVWHVHVTLDKAGDCPSPAPALPGVPPTLPSPQEVSAQSNRAAICEQETSATNPAKAGTDPGNRFTVGFFSYTSFEAVAEPLAGPEPT